MIDDRDRIVNVPFNPTFDSALAAVCARYSEEGYGLIRVVPVHMHQAVAVFEMVHEARACEGRPCTCTTIGDGPVHVLTSPGCPQHDLAAQGQVEGL